MADEQCMSYVDNRRWENKWSNCKCDKSGRPKCWDPNFPLKSDRTNSCKSCFMGNSRKYKCYRSKYPTDMASIKKQKLIVYQFLKSIA
jgi:hypothetical protein